jgi:hypothetical protein
MFSIRPLHMTREAFRGRPRLLGSTSTVRPTKVQRRKTMNLNNIFGRNNSGQNGVSEVDVQGDDFTVRRPQGGEAELSEALAEPEPAQERRGKIPDHSWGA